MYVFIGILLVWSPSRFINFLDIVISGSSLTYDGRDGYAVCGGVSRSVGRLISCKRTWTIGNTCLCGMF